jgi:hypothetical protein
LPPLRAVLPLWRWCAATKSFALRNVMGTRYGLSVPS